MAAEQVTKIPADQIPQEILSRLDVIAKKLGTTIDYLWPQLVKYEMATGFGVLFLSAFFLGLAIWFGLWFKRLRQRGVNFDSSYAAVPALMGICGVGFGISVMVFMVEKLPTIVSPEAAALFRLLGK